MEQKKFDDLALAVSLLRQLLSTLSALRASEDDDSRAVGKALVRLLFYEREVMEVVPRVMRNWEAGRFTAAFTLDLVSCMQMMLSMGEALARDGFLVQKKKIRRRGGAAAAGADDEDEEEAMVGDDEVRRRKAKSKSDGERREEAFDYHGYLAQLVQPKAAQALLFVAQGYAEVPTSELHAAADIMRRILRHPIPDQDPMAVEDRLKAICKGEATMEYRSAAVEFDICAANVEPAQSAYHDTQQEADRAARLAASGQQRPAGSSSESADPAEEAASMGPATPEMEGVLGKTTSALVEEASALADEADAARLRMEAAIAQEDAASERLSTAQQACFPRTFAPLMWHFDFLEVCNAALNDHRLLEPAAAGQRGSNGCLLPRGSRISKPSFASFVGVCLEIVQTLTTAALVSPLVLAEAVTWRDRGGTLLLAVGYDEELVPSGSRKQRKGDGTGRGPSKATLARLEAQHQLDLNREELDEDDWDAAAAVDEDADEEARLQALRIQAWEAAESLPVCDAASGSGPQQGGEDEDEEGDEGAAPSAVAISILGPKWSPEDDKALAEEHASLAGIESTVATLASTLSFPSGARRNETAIRNRCIQLGLEPEPSTGLYVKVVGGRKISAKKTVAGSKAR